MDNPQQTVSPDAVIGQLAARIGQLTVELVIRDVALAEAHTELDALRASVAEPEPEAVGS